MRKALTEDVLLMMSWNKLLLASASALSAVTMSSAPTVIRLKRKKRECQRRRAYPGSPRNLSSSSYSLGTSCKASPVYKFILGQQEVVCQLVQALIIKCCSKYYLLMQLKAPPFFHKSRLN